MIGLKLAEADIEGEAAVVGPRVGDRRVGHERQHFRGEMHAAGVAADVFVGLVLGETAGPREKVVSRVVEIAFLPQGEAGPMSAAWGRSVAINA